MKYNLDQVVRYEGADHKIVGVLIERSDNTSKVMLAINGKVTIIDTVKLEQHGQH